MNINKHGKVFYYFVGLLMAFFCQVTYANVVVAANTIISADTTYDSTSVDMTGGNFIIRNGAKLTISNSTITGTLSLTTPVLFTVERGAINLANNQVSVSVSGITQHPESESLSYVIQANTAKVTLTGNTFSVDQPYSVGLLITNIIIATSDFQISNNSFTNFHGVLYLLNSQNSVIDGNTFNFNSYGQIVVNGNISQITNNGIYFSGRNRLGNAIDLLEASNVTIAKNTLFTPTCHGIYVLGSTNVTIDNNNITGGITYAITLLSNPEMSLKDNYAARYFVKHSKKSLRHLGTSNIVIKNNRMGQNRYGIAATDVDTLTVGNNVFTQRFDDADARKFWTDNNVLLKNVTNLMWTNNLYKEAFTQVNGGDNSLTNEVVPFPVSGGVVL